MRPYVVDLRSRDARQPQEVGGKGAGLSWLHSQGYSVPPGFIVTARAFQVATAQIPEAAKTAAASFRSELESFPLPPEISSAISRAYARLGGPVAVRSSLVGEDASGSSFAGQFDSFLNVSGEEQLFAAIRACWASPFAERASGYLERQELGLSQVAMAVVVQRMVDAEAAGVAFSADPVSGDEVVIIEAARGLGDAVVSGRVKPDRYVIDARGVLAECDQAVPGPPVLTEAQILELGKTVKDLDHRAGGPRDVEWAWDGAGFHLLQCRPITALANRRVYSKRLVADMAPGLVKPMVYSTNSVAVAREVFGRLFRELLGHADVDVDRLVPRIYSRVYADMTLLGELLGKAGLPANMMEMMLRDERAGRRHMPMSMRMLPGMLRFGGLLLRHARLPRQHHAQIARCEEQLDAYRSQQWSGAALPALLQQLDTLTALRNAAFWPFFVSVIQMSAHTKLMAKWATSRAPDVAVGDLTCGLNGVKGLGPSREILRLAQQVRMMEPGLGRCLIEADVTEIRAALSATPSGRSLLGEVEALIGRYGFLSSNGSDFTAVSWEEDPLLIWRAIGRTALGPAVAQSRNPAELREAARLHVSARLGPFSRLIFDRLLSSAQTAIEQREALSGLMSEYSHQMRRLFLAIGEALVARGALLDREDLFYLSYGEMKALASGTMDGADAREQITARRVEMAADAEIDPPDVVAGDLASIRRPAVARPLDLAYLTGIAGSAGTSEGLARIISDPAHAPADLGPKDILVVPYSDVGWTPLFPGVGGVVVETGGQLSHAAIVAREHGLPAVLSVAAATRIIREGQWLMLDGNLGRVYLQPAAD